MSMSKVIINNNKMNEYFGNIALDLALNAVKECAKKYGFNADEAIEELGLNSNHFVFKQTKKDVKESKQIKLAKPKFPFPYSGEYKEECCQGLKYNRGLYTQCLFLKTKDIESSDYCKRCSSQAERNSDNKPDCGSIQERQQSSFMEFRDRKGKTPIHFVKVMRKLQFTKEDVIEEAGKFNITIDEVHFLEPPPPAKKGRKPATEKKDTQEKKKGRPSNKKEVIVSSSTEVEGEVTDLFSLLTKKAAASASASSTTSASGEEEAKEPEYAVVEEAKEPEEAVVEEAETGSNDEHFYFIQEPVTEEPPAVTEEPVTEVIVKKNSKEKSSDKDKESKKTAGKEVKKSSKEKTTEKDKEGKKTAGKEVKKTAGKDSKKEAKKEAEEKAKKEAEEKAKKEAEAEDEDDDDDEDNDLAQKEEEEDEDDAAESNMMNPFKFAGVSYWINQDDIIYSLGTTDTDPEPVGKWDKKKKSIIFTSTKSEADEGSDEESADEYES